MAEEVRIYQEAPGKIWSMTPRGGYGNFESVTGRLIEREIKIQEALNGPSVGSSNYYGEISADNLLQYLQMCFIGLGHTEELAKRRMIEAVERPRISADRLYQQSFVEEDYVRGALAVIAFTAANNSQPEEWVVEGFLGDAIVPEVKTLNMSYPTIWGIDVSDQEGLNAMVEEWYPS